MFFEFFLECVYIMNIEQLKIKRYGNKQEPVVESFASTKGQSFI